MKVYFTEEYATTARRLARTFPGEGSRDEEQKRSDIQTRNPPQYYIHKKNTYVHNMITGK